MEQIRFHLDESVDPDIAEGLRIQGVDVTTTQASSLRSATDEMQLAFALKDRRVVITHDADFLRLAAKGVRHSGIVYCAPNARSLGEIILACLALFHNENAYSMQDR